tara:strand:+ start:141710 stop:141850 length:141 start_codon:yes stop_codon:yes gene_type:complete
MKFKNCSFQEFGMKPNKAMQSDKAPLSRLLLTHKPRQRIFAADLRR